MWENPSPGLGRRVEGVCSQGKGGKKLGQRPGEGVSVWNEERQTLLADSRQPASFGHDKLAVWTFMSPEDSSVDT